MFYLKKESGMYSAQCQLWFKIFCLSKMNGFKQSKDFVKTFKSKIKNFIKLFLHGEIATTYINICQFINLSRALQNKIGSKGLDQMF